MRSLTILQRFEGSTTLSGIGTRDTLHDQQHPLVCCQYLNSTLHRARFPTLFLKLSPNHARSHVHTRRGRRCISNLNSRLNTACREHTVIMTYVPFALSCTWMLAMSLARIGQISCYLISYVPRAPSQQLEDNVTVQSG